MREILTFNSKTIYALLFANLILRVLVMLFTDLGNDEVYYVQYALHPAVSYFDHPPLVGYLVRLSTFNLQFVFNDFFVRLGPLLLGTFNIYLMYRIGLLLANRAAGLMSALLYTLSFYNTIIVGTFILPDTPLSTFWLLALWLFIAHISKKDASGKLLIAFGAVVGAGLAAKYQAIFLWGGAFVYFLLYNRKTLFRPTFWISVFTTALVFSPIIYWNLTSDYSGFNYHSERVGSESWLPTFKYFFPEFFGQLLYNNPFNVLLIIAAVAGLLKMKWSQIDKRLVFLLATGIPLILITLLMSFYNRTLPHWSGPSYFSLLLVTSYCYSQNTMIISKRRFGYAVALSVTLFFLVIGAGIAQINTHIVKLSDHTETERIGKGDFTVDLSIWKEVAEALSHAQSKTDKPPVGQILTHNWFPGAHLDYYYALPNQIDLYVLGDYKKQHEYLRINKLRGEISKGSDVHYITLSNYYHPPNRSIINQFTHVEEAAIIPIKKNGKVVVNLFVWRMEGLKETMRF